MHIKIFQINNEKNQTLYKIHNTEKSLKKEIGNLNGQ